MECLIMKRIALLSLAALLVAGCLPMGQMGPVSHGTSPEVCANIIARANSSPDPATKAYALLEAAKIGC
jgi:hypothetical protein